MNITRENIDDLNALLTIKVEKTDYEEKVETVLKDYRKKANIKGFRPGMVPIGLVRKIYGKAVRIDEINKVVTENIQKYLSDEKLEILGDPLPHEHNHEIIDFETQEEFSFTFEIGLSPAIDAGLSEKDEVNNYEIVIDEKMRNDYIDNYKRRFGDLRQVDETGEKDVVKGDIEALGEDGNPKEEGLKTEGTSLGLDVIKDDEIKVLFTGKSIGDTVDFDLRKAYPNDSEIAGILKITREDAEGLQGMYRFTIKEISRFFPAEVNQELFDNIYGEGVVNSDEEFIKKVDEEISANLRKESEYKLMIDLKHLAMNKTEIKLPEDFLKKWLLTVNEQTTEEQIEKEFDNFRKDLKWQLIKNKVARDNEIKISEEELVSEAARITRYQFQQYGLYYATDEQIEKYARETLKKEDDAKRIAERIVEDKVLGVMKNMVSLKETSITAEEFNKLFETASNPVE
jgi:trigger factor